MCQKDDVAQKGRIYNTSLNQKNNSPVYRVAKTDPNTSRQTRIKFLAGIKKTNSPENVYVRLVLAGNKKKGGKRKTIIWREKKKYLAGNKK